jgi:regulatory protein YycI of two-component signal transduction system YycFG
MKISTIIISTLAIISSNLMADNIYIVEDLLSGRVSFLKMEEITNEQIKEWIAIIKDPEASLEEKERAIKLLMKLTDLNVRWEI